MIRIKLVEDKPIGLLQLTITWYKIRHAGGQAHYYSPTGTLKQRQVKLDWFRSLCFNVPVGEIIMSLPSSMADFVPCDRYTVVAKGLLVPEDPVFSFVKLYARANVTRRVTVLEYGQSAMWV